MKVYFSAKFVSNQVETSGEKEGKRGREGEGERERERGDYILA